MSMKNTIFFCFESPFWHLVSLKMINNDSLCNPCFFHWLHILWETDIFRAMNVFILPSSKGVTLNDTTG